MTVNDVVPIAVPPAVVIVIFPDFANAGTIAVTCLSLFTVKLAVLVPNFTSDVCDKLTPLMVTEAPTGPLAGLNEVITGVTRKSRLLGKCPAAVVTVTGPFFAPSGTVAVRNVSETTVKDAGVPFHANPLLSRLVHLVPFSKQVTQPRPTSISSSSLRVASVTLSVRRQLPTDLTGRFHRARKREGK